MFFHLLLIFIFFFPFYFWVRSLLSMLAVILILFILGMGLIWFLHRLPQRKTEVTAIRPSLTLMPTTDAISFEWGKRHYQYDFEKEQLLSSKTKPSVSGKYFFHSKALVRYYDYSLKYLNKIRIHGISRDTATVAMWLLGLILIAFIFSYPSSLLVGYSNILFIIPYLFLMGEYLFFRSFHPFQLYGQMALMGILFTISFYRVKT
jgi:hypothetical protein